jgi:hypothetical protein
MRKDTIVGSKVASQFYRDNTTGRGSQSFDACQVALVSQSACVVLAGKAYNLGTISLYCDAIVRIDVLYHLDSDVGPTVRFRTWNAEYRGSENKTDHHS